MLLASLVLRWMLSPPLRSIQEVASYTINGGTAVDVDAVCQSGTCRRPLLGTPTGVHERYMFGAVDGNYDLAQLTLNITSDGFRNRHQLGLAGLALVGLRADRPPQASRQRPVTSRITRK